MPLEASRFYLSRWDRVSWALQSLDARMESENTVLSTMMRRKRSPWLHHGWGTVPRHRGKLVGACDSLGTFLHRVDICFKSLFDSDNRVGGGNP
jgi:hypothetical protein